LAVTLPLSDDSSDRADGKKLKKRLLLSYEWDLLKQIVELLEPFDDATTYFSGTSYATLSVIYPLIQVLKEKYAYGLSFNDFDNEQGKLEIKVLFLFFFTCWLIIFDNLFL
jgi:hypothetical protein